MDLGGSMAGWHKRLAAVAGAMALTLVRRGMTREMLRQWGAELRAVAQEMRETSEALDAKNGVHEK